MKKTKLPAFLIAHNDLAQPGTIYIVYTRKPAFIAQAISFKTVDECLRFLQTVQPESAVQLKRLPLVLQLVLPFENPTEDVPRILRRMADWYYYTHLKHAPAGTEPPSEPAD